MWKKLWCQKNSSLGSCTGETHSVLHCFIIPIISRIKTCKIKEESPRPYTLDKKKWLENLNTYEWRDDGISVLSSNMFAGGPPFKCIWFKRLCKSSGQKLIFNLPLLHFSTGKYSDALWNTVAVFMVSTTATCISTF